MTAEEKDAVVGRLIRERDEGRRDEAALRAECSKIGAQLQAIGLALTRKPENVIFAGQPHDSRFNEKDDGVLANLAAVNGERILSLTNDLRAALLKLWETQRHLDAFGIR